MGPSALAVGVARAESGQAGRCRTPYRDPSLPGGGAPPPQSGRLHPQPHTGLPAWHLPATTAWEGDGWLPRPGRPTLRLGPISALLAEDALRTQSPDHPGTEQAGERLCVIGQRVRCSPPARLARAFAAASLSLCPPAAPCPHPSGRFRGYPAVVMWQSPWRWLGESRRILPSGSGGFRCTFLYRAFNVDYQAGVFIFWKENSAVPAQGFSECRAAWC